MNFNYNTNFIFQNAFQFEVSRNMSFKLKSVVVFLKILCSFVLICSYGKTNFIVYYFVVLEECFSCMVTQVTMYGETMD